MSNSKLREFRRGFACGRISVCWKAGLAVNDPDVIHAALAEAFSAQKQHLPRGFAISSGVRIAHSV